MLRVVESGLYCERGDFFIDPWHAVDRALITHAHSDHARPGSHAYLCAASGQEVLRHRVGHRSAVQGLPYGERLRLGDVLVSFHPAGHVLGSAQIRVEHRGEVWVVSGDYKRQADPTCTPFEPVRCHVFITESTFGLPIYRWPDPARVLSEIRAWHRQAAREGRVGILHAYSLGKAQRLLAGLDPSDGPLWVHPAIAELLPAYRAAGIPLPDVPTLDPRQGPPPEPGLLLAPPGIETDASRRWLADAEVASASGWMLVRGPRRRQGAARGFVLSDHADWPALVTTIRETGAPRILVTHGAATPLVRWLRENGWDADALATRPPDDAAPPGAAAHA